MYRIRFHGRGGQGMKTAANIVGSAFFAAGYEVQDAPRYGAERRGAPMFAYVRAAREPIVERGAIAAPDLVVVSDTSLLGIASAAVMQGACARTVMFANSAEPAEELRARLGYPGIVVTWPSASEPIRTDAGPVLSARCAGAAARLVGVIARDALAAGLDAETAERGAQTQEQNRLHGLAAYDLLERHAGEVEEGQALASLAQTPLDWVRLSTEDAAMAVPDIFRQASSELAKTGLWRTSRPVIDYEHCNRCSWVCSTLCPDSAIRVDAERMPQIDYEHCKGCMICLLACPPHAIRQVPEDEASARGAGS